MTNRIPAADAPQLPFQQSLDADAIRIDLERVSDVLFVRLRPAHVPPGISNGPRVALELRAEGARALGNALLRHAAALAAQAVSNG
ncbi:hypothetical protein [Tahibacter caeni]|uniref:hypothetical protein n=1 Tax=Tahibacter caeni TaxID=1453545 RepID=UPI002147C046|nr:hypothetical protein [Tahibacter caeni]